MFPFKLQWSNDELRLLYPADRTRQILEIWRTTCIPDIFIVVRSRWVPETASVPSAFHPVAAGFLEFPVSHLGSSVKAPQGDLSPSVRRQSPDKSVSTCSSHIFLPKLLHDYNRMFLWSFPLPRVLLIHDGSLLILLSGGKCFCEFSCISSAFRALLVYFHIVLSSLEGV